MIKVLEKSVAELIAAGEVIERPASVVKELIENSIDAGAKSITVEIKDGGISFLRISDDGCGIPHEQCPIAFLRHATSKVSNSEDLEAINTLGFRGEALASVAAVGKVSMFTKTADCELGTSYVIEGGNEIEHTEAGCIDGTAIIIRELFYNMPARLKFLKKNVSEGNAIQSVIDKAALINPQIAFRFIRDNKMVRVTPGDGKMYSAIYAVYGKQFAVSMTAVDYSQNGINVSGYVSSPLFCKSNRAFQNFYVNSRYIRSATCSAALEEAYRNSIMKGKFPACIINVSINPTDVDANVHPAKTEVRFINDRNVFSTVYIAVKNALLNDETKENNKTDIISNHQPQISEQLETTTTQNQSDITVTTAPSEFPQSAQGEQPQTAVFNSSKTEYEYQPVNSFKHINKDSFLKRELPSVNQSVLIERLPEQVRVLGELFATYVVCEYGDELVLVDKHAADERLRFEELKKQLKVQSQILLEPIKAELDSEYCGRLLQSSAELEQIGLRIEDGGNGEVLVAAMPVIIESSVAKVNELLSEIAELLINGSEVELTELGMVNEIMHTVACRTAIKAGDKSVMYDIEQLAKRVLSDAGLRYCPHGRPTYIKISKHEIEKKFKRIL